ncbi:T9SS type A sorting domain-containing protein [Flavobacterium sp. AS60]|uniref:fibronectin type III domain-containing protein n=1 Tax=Flavobacterium anseongense TaxID=2910677 RepID=UPI001F312762|nr:fibronectin type III domain-containing protein [Flavobacterium sp. AS60]MCF6129756.1 T9SS type A sorting domain-containing protein [Flavobacterium sp. AS60]
MKRNYLRKINTTTIDLKLKTVTFLLFLFVFNNAFGQSLDGCSTSAGAGLTVGTSCTSVAFNSTFATDYWNSATGCNASDQDDAWGWFDATSISTTITYTPAANRDAVLHLFTGSCSTSMTALACSDSGLDGVAETITYATTIGVRYLIRIQRYNSNNDMTGTICVYSPPPSPTITNLTTATSGCVGSSITITGTNLSGATAADVKIGGTPVSSITSNNGTTLVAVIGSGTTGTVSVTTTGGTATSIGTFTVNPLPAAIAGASTVCVGATTTYTDATSGGTWSVTNGTGSATITSGGVLTGSTAGTVTVVYTLPTTCNTAKVITVQQTPGTIAGGSASVCVGSATPAFTNPISGGTWTVTNGTGAATITTGGVLTGTVAGTVTVNYTIGSCTPATYAVTVNTTPTVPTTPLNSLITGSGFTVSWTASAGAVNYVLEVYTDAGYTTPAPGSPFTIASPTVTYAVTGLNSSTPYYYRIKATNGTCSSAYVTGSVTTSLTNDICSQAIALTVNPSLTCTTTTTGSTVGATDNNETGDCTNGTEKAVWYKFTATSTSHIITVDGVSSFDAVVGVITTCGSATTPTGGTCTDVTTDDGIETVTLTGLTAGVTYYVQVYDYNGDNTANAFTICVTTPAPPINNQCANATNLPCSTSNLAGTTVGALSYTHGTGCLMSNYGVWYTFAGDGNSSTISVTTTNNDIELSISSGSCGSLINIACQDSALSSGTETYTFTTAVGVNYYVYIANWYSTGTSTDTGTFTISRTCVVPYNPCTSIQNIAACGTSKSVTIAAGTGGYSPSSCGWTTPGVEQIYTFTPASTGNFTITQTSSFDYINYQFKPVSSGCGSSGWTCIDSLYGAETSPSFTLTTGIQYYILLDPEVSTGGSVNFTINCPTAPITNDDPCGAVSLTVNTTCSYATYTNSGAAASGGIPAPGCASYSGSDVWFSAVVPATGVLTVDLQTGVMTDSGMAFYSGTCGSLTLLECDDDDSTNGLMSNISMSGLTPGQTIFIRVWEYGNDNNGTFGICATTPSCPPTSDLYSTVLSSTSATITWASTTPPASNGYQYYVTTTNTPPTSGSTPSGSTAAGVNTITLTGLVAGQDYYFWVRAYCGGSDYSTWFGPTNFTPCNVGSGSGTTSLACPSILSGGLGLSGGNPAAIVCSAASTCTNLEATYLQLNQATNYNVASITYAPPYQYSCLDNQVSVNIDDKWSPIINLPFNFCFYGNNYDKCLIGSNGVITFDTTNNTPGGYSTWSFNADLPNTSLFKNSIFGVYHDIDPGVGGEVGWELITLNTGCRALVASWNNIPMFSSTCNSILYTGMIVLYENTNVIDVFIKEKNVCDTWNNGNAIVGLQNATGTAAVVAPNRNGLSTNWTVTNEAWRFTPSGPSLTSIKWYEGSGTSGTVLGTTDVLNVCPSATTTYTAEVTYALCGGTNLKYTDDVVVTVTGAKIWDGSTSTNWNVDDNWTPSGVPTSADCVVIPNVANDPVISGAPNAVGYNLFLYSDAQLTINSSQNLTITDKVTVQPNGIFTINNSASLIQINNVLNTGNIIYKRESPSVRTLDYSYWSSPVAGFNVNNIVSPYSFGAIYKWNTTIPNSNAGWGAWQSAAGDNMIAGKGYIARAPGTAPFNNTTYNVLSGSFTGVPNNGNITIAIERGPDQNTATHYGTNLTEITNLSDNWNLLGNPYPSAIRASQFLFDNRTKIEGNVRLWTHGNLPSIITPNPFYGSYLSNYRPGDYLQYNFSGMSCCPTADSDLFIGAAQGFFVQMIDGPPVAAADNNTVGFTNSLRSASYSNNTFYKTQDSITSTPVDVNNIERNRIWLDLINAANNQTDRILFGYIENATMGRDSFYDCSSQNTGGTVIYSLIDDAKFGIQGRALPFDVTDQVPIGVNIPTVGNYTIGIAAVDGLFQSQNIYLTDNLLNIIHNLKASPYNFTSQSGEINDRFKVVYIDNTLGTNNPNEITTFAVISNNMIKVESSELIKEIKIYDVAGKLINIYSLNEYKNQFTSPFYYANGVYIAKITLDNDMVFSKKLIH